jgi:hypothetical protein
VRLNFWAYYTNVNSLAAPIRAWWQPVSLEEFMRLAPLLFGCAAFALAQAFVPDVVAAPVSLAPVAVSAELQTSLDDDLGAREGEFLRSAVTRSVTAALARHGATMADGAPLVVEITIIDADPNRPTFEQLGDRPGLDWGRSISIGGAELHGALRGADGALISEVDHRRYSQSLIELTGAESTWSDARRAIRQFAEKIADAYVASAR